MISISPVPPSTIRKFIPNRDIFENISQIVDDIFNDYVVRQGSVQPYFTQYCSGTTTTCEGLSQWGTVALAEEGLVPYEILQRYYGDDINIVFNAPVAASNAPIRRASSPGQRGGGCAHYPAAAQPHRR